MVKDIQIIIQPYPTEGFFLAGSVISGEVVIKTGSNKSYYSKVELTLVGTIESNFTDRENDTRCSHSEELIRRSLTVWEKSETNRTFPKGTSHLPFSLPIPYASSSNVLPSCDNAQTTVAYAVIATITKDKRNKGHATTSTPVKIYPPLNVSAANLQGPQSVQSATPLKSCLCFSAGSIETDIHLPHTGYGVEEAMQFDVQVDNGTRKRISHFNATLLQTIECGGTPKSRLSRRRNTFLYGDETIPIGDKVTGNSIIARSTWAENMILPIPVVPPTFESSDSLLSIKYFVLVRVYITNNDRHPISLKCPVVIGNTHQSSHDVENEPIGQSDFSNVGDNPPSYFDLLQNPPPPVPVADSSVPVSPSAPSLPRGAEPFY